MTTSPAAAAANERAPPRINARRFGKCDECVVVTAEIVVVGIIDIADDAAMAAGRCIDDCRTASMDDERTIRDNITKFFSKFEKQKKKKFFLSFFFVFSAEIQVNDELASPCCCRCRCL